MAINYKALKRQAEAARRDGTMNALLEDIREGLQEGHLKPEEFKIRPLFEAVVPGGYEIVQSWAPGSTGINLNQADNLALLESGAVLSSAFSNITGQIVYSKIMDAYTDEEFVMTPLVENVDTQFNGEKIPGVTRLGDTFESIPENSPYPIAGVGEDFINTPQTVKRGEIVPVSKEAIFFDRTGLIIQRCQELGHFYGVNKEKRIIDAFIDENVTTHRYNWRNTIYGSYQSSTPWINLKTTNGLVDWTNIDAAEIVMSQLIDPGTGEPILITPKHLVVSRNLKNIANQIVKATQVRKGDGVGTTGATTIGANPLDTNYTIVASALLTSRMALTTNWYIADVGEVVKYMQNWPMTIEQAPVNSEMEFTHDIVNRWKVSERGAAVVVQPRGSCKNSA